MLNLDEIDVTELVKRSPILARLVEEVRTEPNSAWAYNRMHNRRRIVLGDTILKEYEEMGPQHPPPYERIAEHYWGCCTCTPCKIHRYFIWKERGRMTHIIDALDGQSGEPKMETTHEQKVAALRGESEVNVTGMWRTLWASGATTAITRFEAAAKDAGFEKMGDVMTWRRKTEKENDEGNDDSAS